MAGIMGSCSNKKSITISQMTRKTAQKPYPCKGVVPGSLRGFRLLTLWDEPTCLVCGFSKSKHNIFERAVVNFVRLLWRPLLQTETADLYNVCMPCVLSYVQIWAKPSFKRLCLEVRVVCRQCLSTGWSITWTFDVRAAEQTLHGNRSFDILISRCTCK